MKHPCLMFFIYSRCSSHKYIKEFPVFREEELHEVIYLQRMKNKGLSLSLQVFLAKLKIKWV